MHSSLVVDNKIRVVTRALVISYVKISVAETDIELRSSPSRREVLGKVDLDIKVALQ